ANAGATGIQAFNPANPVTLTALNIGQAGSVGANFALTGGSLTISGDLQISNGGVGSMTVSGGTLTGNGANFMLGSGGQNATFTQTAGAVVFNGSFPYLANGGGTSTMSLSGGPFTSTAVMNIGVRG